MEFKVDHNYVPTTVMRFRLESIDMNFIGTALPDPSMAERIDALREPNRAEIIFDDSREIDLLIQMLERFRDDCHKHISEWNRKERRC